MATISGVWKFKGEVYYSSIYGVQQSVNFTSNGETFTGINFMDMAAMEGWVYYVRPDGTDLEIIAGLGDVSPVAARTEYYRVDFGSEEQAVTAEFMTWMNGMAEYQEPIVPAGFLDYNGVSRLWSKVKEYVNNNNAGGQTYSTKLLTRYVGDAESSFATPSAPTIMIRAFDVVSDKGSYEYRIVPISHLAGGGSLMVGFGSEYISLMLDPMTDGANILVMDSASSATPAGHYEIYV